MVLARAPSELVVRVAAVVVAWGQIGRGYIYTGTLTHAPQGLVPRSWHCCLFHRSHTVQRISSQPHHLAVTTLFAVGRRAAI